jgi:secondary thiamine-phosphate synthase enzyme
MKQHQEILSISPSGKGLHEVTREVNRVVATSEVQTGLCHVFLAHTSASLVIQENADPSARGDLEGWFDRAVPEGDPAYRHTAEGPDDMPSHIRSALTSTSETIPVVGGALALGTWQGLYLFEHRRRPGRRRLIVHVWGS